MNETQYFFNKMGKRKKEKGNRKIKESLPFS
jgi:hypothetical protein